jgi:nicotinamide mononucleotide transporter
MDVMILFSENIAFVLEIIAVVFGVAYVILAARKNIWCWLMGIISSIASIYLFVEYSKLYSEAILYIYYVVTGIIGWVNWKNAESDLKTIRKPVRSHLVFIGIGILFSGLFYLLVSNIFTDAARPLIDSFTTVFSFMATWITIKRWLSNWIYWIVIDAVTTFLYIDRGLDLYACLMVLYTVLAAYAYLEWVKMERTQKEVN